MDGGVEAYAPKLRHLTLSLQHACCSAHLVSNAGMRCVVLRRAKTGSWPPGMMGRCCCGTSHRNTYASPGTTRCSVQNKAGGAYPCRLRSSCQKDPCFATRPAKPCSSACPEILCTCLCPEHGKTLTQLTAAKLVRESMAATWQRAGSCAWSAQLQMKLPLIRLQVILQNLCLAWLVGQGQGMRSQTLASA